jgi:tetratricopeptide (TPR) repeat protein
MTDDPAATAKNLSVGMELFNAGKYAEVISFASGTSDPALLLLAARSYTETGLYDTAGSLLKDLIRLMPASSYLHSYLGLVLEHSDRNTAAEEYATALILDPENKAALRKYAALLLEKEDMRGAIPSLRALVRLENNPDDIRKLMQTLTRVGEPSEAIALHIQNFGDDTFSHEYIDALYAEKEYQKAMRLSLRAWNTLKDTVYLRQSLEALAALDPAGAERAYRSALDSLEEAHVEDETVSQIRFSYILLEKLLGNYTSARYELGELLKTTKDPVYRLLFAELEARLGNGEAANSVYRELITQLCRADDADPLLQELVISKFTAFLSTVRTKEEVAGIISIILSPYPTPVCLAWIGKAYEEAGSLSQARDWYYRAYRADFIRGGIAYAGFLRRSGDERECETTIRYMMANTSKIPDIETIADSVFNGEEGIYKNVKAKDMIIKKLSSVTEKLSSNGREMLSAGYLYSGIDALERQDYETCKWCCLAGIDVLPCYPARIRVEDFMDVLSRLKGRALAERPVIVETQVEEEEQKTDAYDLSFLDQRESAVFIFLKEHREATEMDLRAVLETRRVAGIVNSMLAKLAEHGISLIEKRGVGERGEVYGYVGT